MKESNKKSKPVASNNKGVMAPAKAEASTAGGKIWDDARFAHLVSDPRFRGIPKSQKKVQIDSRFKSMFKDERFNVKAKVDKYGRKLRPTETAELRKFYELEDDATDEEEQEREREREQRAMEGRTDAREEESEAESDSSDELQLTKEEKGTALSEKVKNRLRTFADDFRRGEGRLHSDDSSEDSSSDDDDEQEDEDEVFIEHVWGELDADAEHTEESSHRLAVCHMDWDRIRAVDIMVLLTSFLPPGSSVKSVKIYPSEFGKERMKEEEERGPQELTVRRDDSEEEEEDDEEAQKERLREYQLNRLKYYYAVAECDSIETADKIYKECDGVEYESTANKIDLRFIPDDMEFGEDEPKDSCTELPDMGKYVPRIFNTSALQQAKVELTWDENDLERKEFNEKLRDGKWAQMPETELKKYVACSSSDEEEADETRASGKKRQKRSVLRLRAPEPDDEDEDSDDAGALGGKEKRDMIAKYKALLSDIKEKDQAAEEDQIGMEFTWKVNGDDGAENERQSSETDHKKNPLPDDVNPFEKILQKKKEKSKRRKELKKRRKRGELVEGSDGEQSDAGSSSDSEDDLPYGVDLNDPFFASAFDEKEFGGPKQKGKKKDPEALRRTKEREEREAAEEARRQAELELLLDDGDDNRAHFNLRAIQEREIDLKAVSKSKRRRLLKKSKREIEEQRSARGVPNGGDNFEVDVEDTRFGAIYSKAEYNIDPTNPSFKKTKGMERLIDHKLKKRQLAENDARDDDEQREGAKKQRKDVATTMLVKSIKRKIGQGT
ncbi:ESF1 homolog [Anopheles bellator]|uniref:ESF1 homolog n=1 Tax=Anopheles bellator TaxID=139047 RepID=UPI002648ACD3|nr:ESF1 homolog [Anopheles bellator]